VNMGVNRLGTFYYSKQMLVHKTSLY